MIIYRNQMPVDCTDSVRVGVVGDNFAVSKDFFLEEITDTNISYTIHLRFADGSVNSVVPDFIEYGEIGTKITWVVKKNDIFAHGFFDVQIEGRNNDELVLQTELVQMFADESLAVEDREYTNPNSENIKLREEIFDLFKKTEQQQTEIAKNTEIIKKSDLSLKENVENKVNAINEITDESENYPSVAFLNDYYYMYEEVDDLLGEKMDIPEQGSGNFITDDTSVNIKAFEYQRVGNFVFLTVNFTLNEKVTASKEISFSGLPFANKTLTSILFLSASNSQCSLSVGSYSTTLKLTTPSVLNAGTRMATSFCYRINN